MLPSFNNLKQNLKKPTNKFKKVNVALIGDSTTNFLATAIKGLGFEYRLKVNLFESDYNQKGMSNQPKYVINIESE